MNLRRALFLGGGPHPLPSVQIRCLDVAKILGCDYKLGIQSVEAIADRYSAFVCVKPNFLVGELAKLAARGKVIWDIIDGLPPKENIAVYLTSTKLARNLFSEYGRVEFLPHHHCNFESQPVAPGNRLPVWIGSRHWLPSLRGFEFERYFVEGMSREDVAQALRRSGIGLNLRGKGTLQLNAARFMKGSQPSEIKRTTTNLFDIHLALNSGIKLINCIGFGIPSISSDEPAYHEFGEDCTIFSSIRGCAKWVRALQNDDDLYMDLRKKCLRQAKKFHIDTIAGQYKKLLESL